MGLTRPRAHQLQDIDYKQTARVITTANVTLSGGAPAVVDGTNLALTNRVLVTAQSTGTENGIYEVTVVGSGSNGTWVRTEDANATGDIKGGTIIMITEGTVYADTQWKLTTDDPITIGSTAMVFVRNGNAAFGIVAANGQSNLVADAIGDTLTLVAGSNITIQTNTASDSVVIATASTVATLAGSQTLTNKTLTTPVINGFTGAGNGALTGDLQLTSTNSGTGALPLLKLFRDSPSPANFDYLGALVLQGEDSASNITDYASIHGRALNVSNGSETGRIEFYITNGGASFRSYAFDKDHLYFFEDQPIEWVDFGGTSNNVSLLPATPSADRTINLPDASGTLALTNNNGNAATPLKVAGLETIWVPASNMRPRTANGFELFQVADTSSTSLPEIEGFKINSTLITGNTYAEFTVALPKSWNGGSFTAQHSFVNVSGSAWNVSSFFILAALWRSGFTIYSNPYGTAANITSTSFADNVTAFLPTGAFSVNGTPVGDGTDFITFQIVKSVSGIGSAEYYYQGTQLFFTTNAPNDA